MSIVYRDPSNGNKYPYTGYPINSQNQVVTFTSSDTTDANASSWTNVATLTSGERHKSIFAKISQMFKNVRYLYKLLGTTDFSGLGSDVSGALSNIGGIIVKGVEKTSTASQAYAVNEYLVYNKKLYRVKAAIAKNATITVGTNVDSANTNVGAELTILNSALMKPYSVFANVSCTNAASSRWGYWGAANLDISTWASGKNILAIIPDGCYLNEAGSSSDENVLGLLHVSYNYTTNSVEYHVNSKFSGRFGCRALILYTE